MARFTKGGRTVHVGYSTNVHRAESLAEVLRFLDQTTVPVKAAALPDRPMGIDLRLGTALVRELETDPRGVETLRRSLTERELYVFGVNGFPLVDFQAPIVKTAVYRPDWTEPERLETTLRMAEILVRLLPPDVEGSISTVAGGYRPFGDDATTRERMAEHLVEAARRLAALARTTGRTVTLSPEPEPDTTLEDRETTLAFYRDHIRPAARARGVPEPVLETYLPVNLDACHLSVAFEAPRATIDALEAEGIRVGKSNLSAALALTDPGADEAGRRRLAAMAEPRFLHQTRGRDAEGRVVLRLPDLDRLGAMTADDLDGVAEIRTHFHVPLFGARGFQTTAAETETFLEALLEGTTCTALAVETYTWPVLEQTPLDEAGSGIDLVAGLAAELRWTIERLEAAGWR